MSIDTAIKQISRIESEMLTFQTNAANDIKTTGKIATDTKNALDALGQQQREQAERLLEIEQSGISHSQNISGIATGMGQQFTNSETYKGFVAGNSQKARFEVKNNTITGSDITVSPDRKVNIAGGAFVPMTLEDFLPSLPTTSNAIEFTRELAFTNAAAETAESQTKPESALTFELVQMPVSTVAHWVKISRQLAADAPALAAYINTRMAYGVNRKVETQLGSGDGVSPNISGLLKAGNYTPHAYTAAALGSVFPKLVLIRSIIADCYALGYMPDAILLNPFDWAGLEIELLTTASSGVARFNVNDAGQPMLFGVPIVQSLGVTADSVLIGAFGQAATIHNRQDVMVELSESDSDNFTKNLITVRAERRLALTVDKPSAIIGGDLTPA